MIAPPASRENRRILIIDDNPAIHNDICKILGSAEDRDVDLIRAQAAYLFGDTPQPSFPSLPRGFDLTSAFQGEEGLEKAREAAVNGRPFSLAIVDCRMPPGWDGILTIKRLWEICPDLQIVICTAFSDYSWEEIVAILGGSDRLVILKKPFDVAEVQQLAESMTRRWARNAEVRELLDDLARQAETVAQARTESDRQLADTRRAANAAASAVFAIQDLGHVIEGADQSSARLSTRLQNSKVASIGRLAEMLRAHGAHLGAFGEKLPGFLAQLAVDLTQERNAELHELLHLRHCLDRIRTTIKTATTEPGKISVSAG